MGDTIAIRAKKSSLVDSNKIDQSQFQNEHVMLLVSVGQKKHYGDYLIETINFINKHKFKKCSILVCDTLQKYNFMMKKGIDEEVAYRIALNKGSEWIETNFSAYSCLNMTYKLIRWDYWLKHENYIRKREAIDRIYQEEQCYRDAIQCSINAFFQRKKGKSLINDNICKELSKEYLLEECSAMLLWAEEGFNYELYPSPRNDAMRYVYEKKK